MKKVGLIILLVVVVTVVVFAQQNFTKSNVAVSIVQLGGGDVGFRVQNFNNQAVTVAIRYHLTNPDRNINYQNRETTYFRVPANGRQTTRKITNTIGGWRIQIVDILFM